MGGFYVPQKAQTCSGPIRSATGVLPGAVLEGRKGCNVHMTSPSEVGVKNEWSCTFTSPLPSWLWSYSCFSFI